MKTRVFVFGRLLALGLFVAPLTASGAFISYFGLPVTENFDALGPNGITTSVINGWYIGAIGDIFPPDGGPLNSLQSQYPGPPTADVLTDASDGTAAPFSGNAAGGLYNYGTSGADDRALGMIASSTIPPATLSPGMAPPDSAIELAIINDSGTDLAAIDLRWTTEQWRASANLTNSTPVLAFFTIDPTQGWTQMPPEFNLIQINNVISGSVGLDGNAPENRAAAGGIYTPPTPIPDGSEFYIRWVDDNDANGTDMGTAIDDFSFVGIVPEPGVLALGLAGLGMIGRRRRR